MSQQTEAIKSYCERHGCLPDAGGRFCLNCGMAVALRPAGTLVVDHGRTVSADTSPTTVTGVDATLAERGGRYGVFMGQAVIAQNIKYSMQAGRNWSELAPDMRETLDMIANKIARILNGDANYIDSWHDIIGYTRLIEDRLTRERDAPKQG